MNTPAHDVDPPTSRLEAHAHDHARVYMAGGNLYVAESGSAADEDSAAGAVQAVSALTTPLLLLCAGAALIVAALFGAREPTGSPEGMFLLAAGGGMVTLAVPVLRRGHRRWQRDRLTSDPVLMRCHDRRLDRTARQLGRALSVQWEREEKLRKVQHPSPLPVRWITEERLSDHWSSINGDAARDTPLDLSAAFASIADVYARVPSGRLLVVGDAGAGKSVLALRFARDRLLRGTPGDRTPVILPLASWNPAAEDFDDWAAARLTLDHPWLAARTGHDISLATELLRTGRLLPVLDGFDELPVHTRPEAVRRLRDSLGQADPFVVTSRTDEFEAATNGAGFGLPGTAAVRLLPLGLDELAEHLPRTSRKTVAGDVVSTKWDPVLTRLRQRPDDARSRRLLGVLRTPLMTSLARTAYSETDHDPLELLDGGRFPTAASLEDHLLDQLIPAVSDRPEQATRWLALLAERLDTVGTQDLAWWQLGRRAPGVLRTLGAVVALGASTAVMRWLFDQTTDLFGLVVPLWVSTGLLGLVSVVDVAWASQGQLPAPRRFRRPASLARALLGAVAGLGLVPVASVYLPMLDPVLLSVLYLAVLIALLYPAVRPAEGRSPKWVLRQDRTAALTSLGLRSLAAGGGPCLRAAAIVLFPVAALRAWQANGGRDAVRPLDWAVTVGVSATGLAVFGVCLSAWGAFTAARVWPWLTGQLPWDLLGFLEDAHRRGILRQSGAYYQFRHIRLQERLAAHARPGTGPSRATPAPRPREALPGVAGPRFVSARSLPTIVFVLGIGVLWAGIPYLPGTPGPRLTTRHACGLLDQDALTTVLPEPEVVGEPEGPMCWWYNEQPIPSQPNVQVQVEVLAPFLRYNAVEHAERTFETESTSYLHEPPYKEHPAGLGEEATTTVELPVKSQVMAETVVRVDNVVLTVTYMVNISRSDNETRVRLARDTETLAHTAVRNLGS